MAIVAAVKAVATRWGITSGQVNPHRRTGPLDPPPGLGSLRLGFGAPSAIHKLHQPNRYQTQGAILSLTHCRASVKLFTNAA